MPLLCHAKHHYAAAMLAPSMLCRCCARQGFTSRAHAAALIRPASLCHCITRQDRAPQSYSVATLNHAPPLLVSQFLPSECALAAVAPLRKPVVLAVVEPFTNKRLVSFIVELDVEHD